jgi:glycosyltransferase involved in cell wall biosynthesis
MRVFWLAARRRIENVVRPAQYYRPIPESLHKFQIAHPLPPEGVERSLGGGMALLVPCYNHAAYLEDTFQAILSQTLRPFEVIFVEDHSSDDTLAKLEHFCGKAPGGIQARILRTPRNLGQAFALNLGVESSDASVFTVLNDDDYLMHDALEAIREILTQNPDIYLFGAHCLNFSGGDFLARLQPAERLIRSRCADYGAIKLTRYTPEMMDKVQRPGDLSAAHSGSTFFKSAWKVAGGYYPEKRSRVVIHSDRDFQLRVASLLPVAIAYETAFSFWRSDSSVDRGLYS